MKKNRLVLVFLVFAYMIPFSTGGLCASQGYQDKDTTVARFGIYNISFEEFKIAYLDLIKRPNVFDSKEMREGFLNELIAARLMAGEAKKIGLDTDTLFNYKVEAFKNKCLRESHYDSIIRPQIKVEDKEIEDAYQYSQEERQLSHLFLKTKEAADSVYTRLLNGAKFEDIAKEIYTDTLLKNSGGSLGWVDWNSLDYDLADAAFKLLPNVFSKPVKSQFGYHILMVKDFKKKPLITRFEYEVQMKKTKYLVEFKKGQQLSYDYLSKLLKDAKITLYPKALQFLQTKVEGQLKRKPNSKDVVQEFQLSEEEVNKLETSLWESRNEAIATVNGEKFTIGEFLGNLNYIPYEIVYSDFDKTLDYSIRDFILTREAKSFGLENVPSVNRKANLYKEYYLKLGLGRKLVDGITVTENEMKKYYQDHRATFKKATYDTCRYVIRELITRSKKTTVIPDFVKAVSKNMEITKHVDIINKYYDTILKGDIR